MEKEQIEKRLNELSDEISELKKELNKPEEKVIDFVQGRKYSLSLFSEPCIYLAAKVDYGRYALISLEGGNRFTAPVPLEEFNSKSNLYEGYIIKEVA